MECPKCGAELVKKEGKYGEFLSCSNFPKCRYSCDLDGSKKTFENIKNDIDQDYGICPKCGSPLVKRNGKFGEFLSCTGFPKCKYSCDLDGTHDSFKKQVLNDEDYGNCPECDSPLVKKDGKFGEFLSCSNFPDCRYSEDL